MKELRFVTTEILIQMRNVVEDFIEDAADVASSVGPQADDALNDMRKLASSFGRSLKSFALVGAVEQRFLRTSWV